MQVKINTNIAKEDELKAMAAMFEQQTANWEETQEKMSQLVSRLAFSVIVVPFSNEHSCFHSRVFSSRTVHSVSIAIREVAAPAVEESRSRLTTQTGRSHRATSVIAVARKVRGSLLAALSFPYPGSRSLDPRLSDE